MVAIVYGASPYPTRGYNGIDQAAAAAREATGSLIDYFGNMKETPTKTTVKLPPADGAGSDDAPGTAAPEIVDHIG